tara:strand:+ start:87 stop:1259 length:1173 start_codon:yes stop_codon:yes gene_type:complete
MRLLISTGEVSGDLQGSFLIEALYKEAKKRSLNLEIVALGGPRMEAAGAKLIANTSSFGAIGLLEVLPFVFPTLIAQSKVNKLLKTKPPNGVILIDYMGPNIRLGNKIKKLMPSVPITYYIAPQEWAWRMGDDGTTDLIRFTDKILAIFKLEEEFYSSKGGSVKWVGHPMLDTFKILPDKLEAKKKLGIAPDQKLVLLLPASRSQELKYLMPPIIEAANILQRIDPSLYFIIPSGLDSFDSILNKKVKLSNLRGRVIPANKSDSMKKFLFAAADLALGKSGTVNMELALYGIPQIVGYKVSKFTAFIARKILRFNVDHISPVNLLLKERLVPELVQEDFTPDSIAQLAELLLADNNFRANMISGYKRLRLQLGNPGVTSRAAKEILDLIE